MKYQQKNNELVPMTRRYPNLRKKALHRDSKVAEGLIKAWDVHQDQNEVLGIFLKNKHKLSDYRYWELLRTVWIICGSTELSELFRKLMSSGRKHKYYFSTPEEAEKLRGMPQWIEVYRATNNENDNGLSWTDSLEYAQWFKNAFRKAGIIHRQISKTEIFAYIERNKESEILIL